MNKIFVWVKYQESQAVEIDATDCRNVNELKELVKVKFPSLLGSVDSALITLCTTTLSPNGTVNLEPLLSWSPVPLQSFNTDGSPIPLIIQIIPSPKGIIVHWFSFISNYLSPGKGKQTKGSQSS